MKLDDSYNLNFLHVEEGVAQSYREGVSELRESDNPKENLRVVVDMFNHLGNSRASRGMGVEWASEIIPAYRNLGRILKEIQTGGISSLNEYLDPLFSEYSDLFDGYKEDLDIEEESKLTQLKKAIEELSELKKVLNEYGIDDLGGLEKTLKRLDEKEGELSEMEDKVKEYEQKSQKLENL